MVDEQEVERCEKGAGSGGRGSPAGGSAGDAAYLGEVTGRGEYV